MPMSVAELARLIDPQRTALFLGAGASVASGGPTGSTLAERAARRLGHTPGSDDFVYVCSILEMKYGRRAVIEALRTELDGLEPAGGLLGLPLHKWASIYTTNYDRLVEDSYRLAREPLVVLRSNYDFGPTETREGVRLYKVHGCITQDEVDGHKSRMLISERDYESFSDYREAVFKQLQFDLLTKDVVFLGYSLSDPHLRRDVDQALRLKREQALSRHIYVLSYTRDDERALLYEAKGIKVGFGELDQFLYELVEAHPEPATKVVHTSEPFRPLSRKLEPTIIDVSHARSLQPNAVALFHGRPATYADIASHLTITRDGEESLRRTLADESSRFVTILGVGGVGKTTLARRVGLQLHDDQFLVWEHRPQFPFLAEDWLGVERRLRENSKRGILILDDGARYQRQLNILAGEIGRQEDSNLQLIITSANAEWSPRTKSPALYALGREVRISRLSDTELDHLLALLEQKEEIRSLVDAPFSARSHREQFATLRRRCSADMFVCLKNIFASDALDTILLQEFASLSDDLQEIYRLVAALEASGMQVHRQLVIRMTGIESATLSGVLSHLEGIVDEFDINPADGVFGWSTRHTVIAEVISKYKFADVEARHRLFRDVIDSLNPALWIEQRAIRDLCSREHGIGAIPDSALRIDLLRRMIRLTPNERIPWHRLIATLLEVGALDEAEDEVRRAVDAVGRDSPINRFEVRIWLRRSRQTEGILDEDRLAMILQAETLALRGIQRSPSDKYSYRVYGDVGLEKADLTGETVALDDAITRMRAAEDALLDPELTTWLSDLERKRSRFSA